MYENYYFLRLLVVMSNSNDNQLWFSCPYQKINFPSLVPIWHHSDGVLLPISPTPYFYKSFFSFSLLIYSILSSIQSYMTFWVFLFASFLPIMFPLLYLNPYVSLSEPFQFCFLCQFLKWLYPSQFHICSFCFHCFIFVLDIVYLAFPQKCYFLHVYPLQVKKILL